MVRMQCYDSKESDMAGSSGKLSSGAGVSGEESSRQLGGKMKSGLA